MLPILRIIPVGGVLLAIILLVLALSPPDRFHSRFQASMSPARGALMERADHPEWRQFLILAATRRADELNRLQELPDRPRRSDMAQPVPKVAELPAGRRAPDPDEATGSVPKPAGTTLPLEIGEPSAAELPVTKQEETPPVTTPALLKSGHQSRVRRKHRREAATKPEATPKPYVGNDAYQAKAGTINP